MEQRPRIIHLDSDPDHLKQYKERHEVKNDIVGVEDLPSLKHECKQRVPDIVQVDVFSPSSDSYQDLVEVEILLKLFGEFRYIVRDRCKQLWEDEGIKNAKAIRAWLDENGMESVPVAISSRYARRILDGDDVREVELDGNYWVWKRRVHNYYDCENEEQKSIAKELVLSTFSDDFIDKCFEKDKKTDEEKKKADKAALRVENASIDEVIKIHAMKQKYKERVEELELEIVNIKAKNNRKVRKLTSRKTQYISALLVAITFLLSELIYIDNGLLSKLASSIYSYVQPHLYILGTIASIITIIGTAFGVYRHLKHKKVCTECGEMIGTSCTCDV